MKNHVKHYIISVSSKLRCDKALKSVFLRQLKDDVATYAAQQETVTVDELRSEFGAPEAIAEGFFNRADYPKLLKQSKRKTIFWVAVSIISLILFAFVVALTHEVIVDLCGATVTISGPTIL